MINYLPNGIMGVQCVDGTPALRVEPHIEEITKEDLIWLYKDIKKQKPIQLPIGEFLYRECDNGGCSFIGVVHQRQHFCPLCYHIMSEIEKDINEGFDERFQMWQSQVKLMERIINGNVSKFVMEFNETLKTNKPSLDKTHEELMDSVMEDKHQGYDVIGEEIIVDE